MMEVNIDKYSGFCFELYMQFRWLKTFWKRKKAYCLGDIVHNNKEVDRLHNMGLEIITHDDLKPIKLQSLIRAHGELPSTYSIALKNNIQLLMHHVLLF